MAGIQWQKTMRKGKTLWCQVIFLPPQIPKFSLSNSQGGHKNTILGHSGPNPAACLSPGTAPLPAGGFSQRVLVWGRMDEQPE